MAHDHLLTGEHVIRSVYDADTKSLKSKMIPMEMAIELNHADGDSVVAHKAVKQHSLGADEAGVVLGSSKISVYSAAAKQVSIAPDDSEDWIAVGVTGANGLLTVDVCTHKVKREDACKVVAV